MGGKQSNLNSNDRFDPNRIDEEEEDDGVCKPCFFLNIGGGNHRRSSSAYSDPMGSPLPDTPTAVRHRKQAVRNALKNERKNPIFSSRYEGLEKEVSTSLDGSNQSNLVNGEAASGSLLAQVHEVKVRIFILIFFRIIYSAKC